MDRASALKLAQKSDFLIGCQERTGIAFDKAKAEDLYKFCCEEMGRIEQEVEPQLPLRKLNKAELKKVTPPKVQFKNSKQGLIPSANAEKFFDVIVKGEDNHEGIHTVAVVWVGYIKDVAYVLPYHEPVTTSGVMRLKHQANLKNWLLAKGWRPTLWNFKKDRAGKFIRDERGQLIKTSPKFHDKGVICSNLETMADKIGLIKPIVRWLSLRNRRSVIHNPERNTGWLANPRLVIDGRLPAGASNITNTHRQKHHVVANIPRVSSYLGLEMRGLFCASEGNVLVGYDAAGLEARVEAHWCYRYKGGKTYADELLNGDTHSNNAKIFYGDDIPTKEGKVVSKYRNPSKNGKYALTYGCTAPRLADTLNVPSLKAKGLYEAFWVNNTALAGLRDQLTRHWEANGKHKIHCSLTGHTLLSRSKHSLVNLLFQHTGAIIMDLSLALMDMWLGGIKYDSNNLPYYRHHSSDVRRVIYYHDEAIFECPPEIAEEIKQMGIKSIVEAGKMLGLNVLLDADGAIGKSWAKVH